MQAHEYLRILKALTKTCRDESDLAFEKLRAQQLARWGATPTLEAVNIGSIGEDIGEMHTEYLYDSIITPIQDAFPADARRVITI